jgi:hypothetical protein
MFEEPLLIADLAAAFCARHGILAQSATVSTA